MKITTYLTLGLLAFSLSMAWAQDNAVIFNDQPVNISAVSQTKATKLTKFNLKFPGGTPADLVAAIEQATGKSLNVIIPTEAANTQLPPLKMDSVTTPQLFSALQAASYKQENRVYHPNIPFANDAYQTISISYGFKTEGDPSDASIWYFHVENPPAPPPTAERPPTKICRFYQLAPYLNSGLTVDDITTAIQTGWQMMGETSAPNINFHKETKLLIAVGEEKQLQVISDVLSQLLPTVPMPHPDNHAFQQRLQNIINHAPQPPTDSSAPPALSPEAQAILLETEREKNSPATPPPAPKPPVPADVKP